MKFQPPCLRFHEIGPYVVYPPPLVYIDMYGACATWTTPRWLWPLLLAPLDVRAGHQMADDSGPNYRTVAATLRPAGPVVPEEDPRRSVRSSGGCQRA